MCQLAWCLRDSGIGITGLWGVNSRTGVNSGTAGTVRWIQRDYDVGIAGLLRVNSGSAGWVQRDYGMGTVGLRYSGSVTWV
jgi:hypothetical protein